jgi:hypothetical protein
MGYRVVVEGVAIECDSIDDAIALARRAAAAGAGVERSAKDARSSVAPIVGNSRWTEARMASFFSILKGDQRKLVEELLENPEGRTDNQLLSALGLRDGRALGGVFTSVWKNAKKIGADPNDVYVKQNVNIGDERRLEYTLSESFRHFAEKVRATAKR